VAATESIRAAITEAERRAQVSVEGAVVGVGGASVEGMNGRGLYEFGRPREIDPVTLTMPSSLHRKYGCRKTGSYFRSPHRILRSTAGQDIEILAE
jgi:hypothetical protein